MYKFHNLFLLCSQKLFLWYNLTMKVIRDLEITASEFFGAVFAELAAEIKANSGDIVGPEAMTTGFTQVYRPEDPALKVVFKIVEYREEKLYKAVRTSAGATSSLTYEVTPKEGGITVTFTFDNGEPPKKGFLAKFSEAIYYSRMADKLYNYQRVVINEKEGFVEKRSGTPFFPDIRKSK